MGIRDRSEQEFRRRLGVAFGLLDALTDMKGECHSNSREGILARCEAKLKNWTPNRDPDDVTALDDYGAEDDPC